MSTIDRGRSFAGIQCMMPTILGSAPLPLLVRQATDLSTHYIYVYLTSEQIYETIAA